MLSHTVLLDPRYRVPGAPSASSGVAWLRSAVARFCDGAVHTRRRALVDGVVDGLDLVPDPTGDLVSSLLRALGLPAACRADVELVAAAYQPHTPESGEADAAADRLVEVCGGRTEGAAARICVLVQACAAMDAVLAQRRSGGSGPPVPVTRRVGPDGETVQVDLAGAPFGAGPHACPGRSIAEAWVGAVVA